MLSKIKSAYVLPIKKKRPEKARAGKRQREPEELKEGLKMGGGAIGGNKTTDKINSKTLLNKKKSRKKPVRHNQMA